MDTKIIISTDENGKSLMVYNWKGLFREFTSKPRELLENAEILLHWFSGFYECQNIPFGETGFFFEDTVTEIEINYLIAWELYAICTIPHYIEYASYPLPEIEAGFSFFEIPATIVY